MRRFFIRLFQAGCFGLFGYAVPRLLVASGLPLDDWINEAAVMISPDLLPWLNYESVTWGFAALFAIGMVVVESRFRVIGRFFQKEPTVFNGPVYWSLTETLSWIAFGEPKTAAQWAAIFKADGLLIRPKEETQGFDQAEHELFEAFRARELTAQGKENRSEIYEDIPHNYFLSNVACQILHNTIDVNQKAGSEMYRWDGPKWRDVKLERQAVLKLWPRQNQ